MSSQDRSRNSEQQDRPETPDETAGKQRDQVDRSKYNLDRDSVEDLTNEPMREEGEDEPRKE